MKAAAMILAAGALLTIGGPALGAGKADLTPKYQAGQKATFVQRTTRTDTIMITSDLLQKKAEETAKEHGSKPGEEDEARKKANDQLARGQATTIEQTAVYELRVVGASDKGAELELELKGVKATLDSARGKASWDSDAAADDKDEANPVYQAFKPALNAVVKITLGPDGQIAKVEGDPRVSSAGGRAMGGYVQALVGPEQVGLRWGPLLWPRPGRTPSGVGDTWTSTSEVSQPAIGKFKFPLTHTLKSATETEAVVDTAGTVTLESPDGKTEAAGKIKDPEVKGTLRWDLAKGMPASATYTQRHTLDINAQGVPVLRKSEVSIETTRKD